jgi:hypothetical protein
MVVATPSISISLERPEGAADGGVAVLAPHDELADEVVVVLADLVAGLVAAVPAGAVAAGRDELGDGCRGRAGTRRRRVLGVDADLDGVAPDAHVVLGERQRLARGDAQLQLDEVEPGDELGGRVLDLQARVHLEVEEPPSS